MQRSVVVHALSAVEIAELDQLASTGHRYEANRARAILMLNDGKSAYGISKTGLLTPWLVSKWLAAYEEGGIAALRGCAKGGWGTTRGVIPSKCSSNEHVLRLMSRAVDTFSAITRELREKDTEVWKELWPTLYAEADNNGWAREWIDAQEDEAEWYDEEDIAQEYMYHLIYTGIAM